MDSTQMFSFIDIMVFGCGLYLFYAWFGLVKKGEVKEGVLISKGAGKVCSDLEGYKKFIGWRLLVFAIMTTLCGGVNLYSDYVNPIDSRVNIALTVVFLAVVIWFTAGARKAEKTFWK